jgi:hypothetical protein
MASGKIHDAKLESPLRVAAPRLRVVLHGGRGQGVMPSMLAKASKLGATGRQRWPWGWVQASLATTIGLRYLASDGASGGRETWPIHPRRARNGRDGTDDVYPDASLTLDERSWTRDTEKSHSRRWRGRRAGAG